jgi:hypothetical protein
VESFAHDVRLVFRNSILYNGESSEVGELAQSMMSRFEKLYGDVVAGKKCSIYDVAEKILLFRHTNTMLLRRH